MTWRGSRGAKRPDLVAVSTFRVMYVVTECQRRDNKRRCRWVWQAGHCMVAIFSGETSVKVFISWSGSKSKALGEAIRDWLPGVIQRVTPYFTPSDVEKGTSWSTDISKELAEADIGILCITRENIHSDWILFEAGALSKSLDKSRVCPILFGISNADLAGPLKQFQTTEFEKGDMGRLISLINTRLGDHGLEQKTLDSVFEKWWPDLEKQINKGLEAEEGPRKPLRSDRDIMEEILHTVRAYGKVPQGGLRIPRQVILDLVRCYVDLHGLILSEGDYRSAMAILLTMRKPVGYISRHGSLFSSEVRDLGKALETLSFVVADEDVPVEDDEA